MSEYIGLYGETILDNIQTGTIHNLTVDESLNITGATLTLNQYDNSTIGFTSNQLYILDNAISNSKLQNSCVSTGKIENSAVSSDKIQTWAITTSKILDSNITTAKIANDAITTVKIADSNITTAKIADDAITTAKVLNSNITTAKINDDAITTAKVLNSNITNAKILSVDGTKITNTINLANVQFDNIQPYLSDEQMVQVVGYKFADEEIVSTVFNTTLIEEDVLNNIITFGAYNTATVIDNNFSSSGNITIKCDSNNNSSNTITFKEGANTQAQIASDGTITIYRNDLNMNANDIVNVNLVDGVDISLFINLTSSEISQLENINATTITSANWGYLSNTNQNVASTSSPSFVLVATDTINEKTLNNGVNIETVLIKDGLVDGVDVSALNTQVSAIQTELNLFPDELKNLTTAEIQQLENIGTTVISSANWGYLSTTNQNIATTSSPSFAGITLTNDLNAGGNDINDILHVYCDFIGQHQYGTVRVSDLELSTDLIGGGFDITAIGSVELDTISAYTGSTVNVSDSLTYKNACSASIYATSTQVIATATTTLINYDTTLYNNGCTVNLTNDSIEVEVAGIYLLTSNYRLPTAGGAGKINGYFYLNGSTLSVAGGVDVRALDIANESVHGHTCITTLSANDVITYKIFQNSGSNITFGSSSTSIYQCRLSVAYLGGV